MGNCCGGEEDKNHMNITEKGNKKGGNVGNANTFDDGSDGKDILEFCNSKVRAIYNDLDPFEIPSLKDGESTEDRPMKLLDNDARYKGDWSSSNDVRHGKGIQVWHDGSMYEGQWRNDKANGKG